MKKYRVQLNPNGYVEVVGEPKFEYGDGELAFYQVDDTEAARFKPDYWRWFCVIEDEKSTNSPLTKEEMQERFFKKIWQVIDFWDKDAERDSTREKMSGLVHTILTEMDGCGELPPMAIYPYIGVWDEWKEQHEVDIGGSLHSLLYRYDPSATGEN